MNEERVWQFEVKVPPMRRIDKERGRQDRAEALEAAMLRPGNWSSDVVRNGKIVTWTMTVPESASLTDVQPISDTIEQVGYYCSDTIGPKSRKAILKVFKNGELIGTFVCSGAW